MQLSCLPVSLFDQIISGQMSLGDWARLGVQAGLDGIDISVLFVKSRAPRFLQETRREIEDAGQRLVMMTTYPDFTNPDAAERRRQGEELRANVEAAAQLGALYVRVTAGQGYPEVGFADGVAWAVEGLTRAVEATHGSGVTLVFENHARPGVWQYPDFSYPPEHFLAIVDQTAQVGLRINFDTANTLAYGDDPIPLLKQVIARVETIHAADTSVRGELQHVLLGTGLSPFPEIFTTLKQAAFDGWICMEEGSRQGATGVIAASEFVRHTWAAA